MLEFLDFNTRLLVAELGARGYGCYRLIVGLLESDTDSLPLNFKVVAKLIGEQPKFVEKVVMNYGLFSIYENAFAIPTDEEKNSGEVEKAVEKSMRETSDETSKEIRLAKIRNKWDRYQVVETKATQREEVKEPHKEEVKEEVKQEAQGVSEERSSQIEDELLELKKLIITNHKTLEWLQQSITTLQGEVEELKEKQVERDAQIEELKEEQKTVEINYEELLKKQKQKELDELKQVTQKFIPPTVEEIEKYAQEKDLKNFDPQAFWNFYESKGWMIGKNKMKKWTCAIANWMKNQDNQKNQNNINVKTVYKYEDKDIALRLLNDGRVRDYSKGWD